MSRGRAQSGYYLFCIRRLCYRLRILVEARRMTSTRRCSEPRARFATFRVFAIHALAALPVVLGSRSLTLGLVRR